MKKGKKLAVENATPKVDTEGDKKVILTT